MKKILFFLITIPFFTQAQIITTFAGNGTFGYGGDLGPSTSAALSTPEGVAVDDSGNVYIADPYNSTIRKVNSLGIITTIAGNGTGGFSNDGERADTAELAQPKAIAIDKKGNIYISESYRIRKINTSGIITSITGIIGSFGHGGDGGPATAAELCQPMGIAVDSSGNIFFADAINHSIRKINTLGIITTIAGNGVGEGTAIGSYSGDGGPATAAGLNLPQGIALDTLGNVYIADAQNGRIRKVNSLGVITTIAGGGTASIIGDGGPATSAYLELPTGVAIDNIGNIYIADDFDERIRKVNTSGIITTIAGNGTKGYTGDGGLATLAELFSPLDIKIDGKGNIYIADYNNSRVRHLTLGKTGLSDFYVMQSIQIFPTPANVVLNIDLTKSKEKIEQIKVMDMNGREMKIMYSAIGNTIITMPVNNLPAGMYMLQLQTGNGVLNEKIVVAR